MLPRSPRACSTRTHYYSIVCVCVSYSNKRNNPQQTQDENMSVEYVCACMNAVYLLTTKAIRVKCKRPPCALSARTYLSLLVYEYLLYACIRAENVVGYYYSKARTCLVRARLCVRKPVEPIVRSFLFQRRRLVRARLCALPSASCNDGTNRQTLTACLRRLLPRRRSRGAIATHFNFYACHCEVPEQMAFSCCANSTMYYNHQSPRLLPDG